jgi:thiamine-monophosphate kinase
MSDREFDLIGRYFSGLSPVDTSVTCGIGDDAAIIDFPPDQELLVAVDTLVNHVHFSSDTSAFDIGYKSMAVNISDIASMGAIPRWATLALTIPKVDPDWLLAFAKGFADIANKYGVTLIGGDTTQGPLSITVQILGTAVSGQSIRRSGASPGDLIYVSGCLGAAGFACRAIRDNDDSQSIPAHCLERLNRPCPRVELARELSTLATAAIDVSDGLAADLSHILKASDVAAEVYVASLPVCQIVDKLEDKIRVQQLALAAGDDYELCFTIAAAQKNELEQRTEGLSYPVTCIGRISSGEGISWLDESDEEMTMNLSGYQHF